MTTNNFVAKISKEEIYSLPLTQFEGNITLVQDEKSLLESIHYLKNQTLLGFDTETKPAFKKGKVNKVALLQLATENRAFLFRLNKIGLANELKSILSDDGIVKIGAAIRDDIKSLASLNHFHPKGFIDLQNIVKDYNIESLGLRKLAAIVLNIRISKAQQVSNWENDELIPSQVIYAATDAWVCLMIYRKLVGKGSKR